MPLTSLLVTGGTGTLGRSLIARALKDGVERVVVYSRDEFKHYMLREAFGDDRRLRLFLGDVRDRARLERAMWGVDAVVHTAALKWVATGIDDNTAELYRTNIDGTRNVVDAAVAAGVGRVVVISSDKACHPVNAYGVSKAAAERYAVGANSFAFPRGTKIAVVRLGNLLWSRGSVAHRFAEMRRHQTQAEKPKGPWSATYRLTRAGMTRFGILRSQAVDLVLWTLENLRGGEIMVPLLPSFRIEDVAHAVQNEWAGHGNETARLEIVGERGGGEKLHEMLMTPEEVERSNATRFGWIIEPERPSWTREPWQGSPAPFDQFTSGTNTRWLSQAELIESFSEMDAGLSSA